MSATVSDYLIYRLIQWGVRRIYGYPGDGINGVIHGITLQDMLDDAKRMGAQPPQEKRC